MDKRRTKEIARIERKKDKLVISGRKDLVKRMMRNLRRGAIRVFWDNDQTKD